MKKLALVLREDLSGAKVTFKWQARADNKAADALANELLTSAAEDPTLLSDSEIIALLY